LDHGGSGEGIEPHNPFLWFFAVGDGVERLLGKFRHSGRGVTPPLDTRRFGGCFFPHRV
jgi:hypothetical protein